MSPIAQLNLPPTTVVSVNRSQPFGQPKQVVAVNLLRIVRQALVNSSLSQDWLSALFGCSKQLISAQLSDEQDEKHLSMRKMGRIDDAGFWKEFLLLLAEDLGLEVMVVTPEQKQAIRDVMAASANLQRVNAL
jgi:hypothetical protein